MAVNLRKLFAFAWLKGQRARFVSKSPASDKPVLHMKSFAYLAIAALSLFVAVVCLMPEERNLEFTVTLAGRGRDGKPQPGAPVDDPAAGGGTSAGLWARPRMPSPAGGGGEVNYGAPMLVGSKGGNAKTQVRAGQRLALRTTDAFMVSQESVPILAELIIDGWTDSGLRIPAGSRLYGEATFQRDAERATVRFTQLSLPSGRIRRITAVAFGRDGQPGIEGKVHSDGAKNAGGQFLTEFIGGLASGSVQADVFGRSQGGLQNGLLSAVAVTAKTRAQSYGEKLKAERQWIEVPAGTECEALLTESYLIQEQGDE